MLRRPEVGGRGHSTIFPELLLLTPGKGAKSRHSESGCGWRRFFPGWRAHVEMHTVTTRWQRGAGWLEGEGGQGWCPVG